MAAPSVPYIIIAVSARLPYHQRMQQRYMYQDTSRQKRDVLSSGTDPASMVPIPLAESAGGLASLQRVADLMGVQQQHRMAAVHPDP
eukprot:6184301-Pleurochrysis_carterae.AAC.5